MSERGEFSYCEIDALAEREGLRIFGGFHPDTADELEDDVATLLMLGPIENRFWEHVSAQKEFADSAPNPLDRWSSRAIGKIAGTIGGKAFFPFGGPPWHPFHAWAIRTGRCWESPVLLLVHDTAGLFVSFRGAIGLRSRIALPESPRHSPCDDCLGKPCRQSCPVGAIGQDAYDADLCKSHIRKTEGRECVNRGCAVRRSCPVSAGAGRSEEQSRFHQRAFLDGTAP